MCFTFSHFSAACRRSGALLLLVSCPLADSVGGQESDVSPHVHLYAAQDYSLGTWRVGTVVIAPSGQSAEARIYASTIRREFSDAGVPNAIRIVHAPSGFTSTSDLEFVQEFRQLLRKDGNPLILAASMRVSEIWPNKDRGVRLGRLIALRDEIDYQIAALGDVAAVYFIDGVPFGVYESSTAAEGIREVRRVFLEARAHKDHEFNGTGEAWFDAMQYSRRKDAIGIAVYGRTDDLTSSEVGQYASRLFARQGIEATYFSAKEDVIDLVVAFYVRGTHLVHHPMLDDTAPLHKSVSTAVEYFRRSRE